MTAQCNVVVLLGTVSATGLAYGFLRQRGQWAEFDLCVGDEAIPCCVYGALATKAAQLQPGDMVTLHGSLETYDAELGDGTGRRSGLCTGCMCAMRKEDM